MTDVKYWSPGIVLDAWKAVVNYEGENVAHDDPDHGHVRINGCVQTRRHVADGRDVDGLSAAIDAVKTAADGLGITWGSKF